MHTHQSAQTPTLRRDMPVGAVTTLGLFGLILGATQATARDIRKVKAGEMTREAALADIARDAAGCGLATAVGAAAAGTFFGSGILGLTTMAAVSVGARYFYDGLLQKEKACETSPAPKPKAEAKTSAAKA